MILDKLFLLMSEKQASDIFISAGAPINIKIQGSTMPVNQQVMLPEMIDKIAYELMSPEQIKAFEATWEMNLSFGLPKVGNFRSISSASAVRSALSSVSFSAISRSLTTWGCRRCWPT